MRAHPSLKVARIVVPVGAHEVPVLAEQRGRQAVDARVVEQGAEARVAVEEGHDAAPARRGVVRLAVLPAAVDLARPLGSVRSLRHSRQKIAGRGFHSIYKSTAD